MIVVVRVLLRVYYKFTLYVKTLKNKKEITSKLKYAQYVFVLLYFCIKK